MKITPRIVAHRQGSEAWHQHRATHLNASDLAAVLGLSAYRTRSDLIRIRATGVEPEIDAMTARRFEQGHEFEAIAREWAEEMLDDTLYPTVLAADVDGLPVSASLDGQTLDGAVIFEHKSGNAGLLASLEAGVIPEQYHPQMEQGLMLSGAERCLFMASSGNRDGMRFAWYTSRPELRAQIIPAWKQFLADVAAYQTPTAAEPVRAERMDSLPAVAVRLDGALTVTGNLPAFAAAARAFIERIPKKPVTDNDFATTDAACKALKKAEDALDAAESGALASITDVEEMRRMVADCRKLVRDARLSAEKLVKARKEQIREEEVARGVGALRSHIVSLNERIGRPLMPAIPSDFGGVIKGLKTIDSLRNAIDTELARAKIAASTAADSITVNLRAIDAAQAPQLFPDVQALVLKAPDDLAAVIAQRVAAEQERKRAEEVRRASEEAARIAAAEQRAREQEAARMAEAAKAAEPAAPAPAPAVSLQQVLTAVAPAPVAAALATPAPRPAAAPWDADPAEDLDRLLSHIALAFDCKFPTQPKPSVEWWAELRTLSERVRAGVPA